MAVVLDTLKKTFWSLPATETQLALETGEDGLSLIEVASRLKLFGENTISDRAPLTRLTIFARQFKSPLIFILLLAAGITLVLRDYHDAGFILAAALTNALLGFYQENKAEHALSDLKTYVTQRVRVRRQGQDMEIESSQLVPGDMIHLVQGDRVPADARLTYVSDLAINQSILTGESLAVDKSIKPDAVSASVADRDSMVFSGTTVVGGIAEAVVTATDEYTELGKIVQMVAAPEAEATPLQIAITKFSVRASLFFVLLSGVMFFVARGSGVPLLDAFLISVAILVAAVPEGLPIVMTVILAIGVQRLAAKNGIVRRLSAAETLGSTTVILTDKTGTLTQAKMSLETIKTYSGVIANNANRGGNNANIEEDAQFMLYAALLNTDVVIENQNDDLSAWRIMGRPIDVAVVRAAAEHGLFASELKEGKRAVHILPFNSKNKFAATVHPVSGRFADRMRNKNGHLLSLFGAPEAILKFANYSETERAAILADVESRAKDGERVVGVAYKEIENINEFSIKEHRHLSGATFLGFLGFKDPLRPTVKDAISQVTEAGIKVVIVTGDHEGTAVAVAKELGFDTSHPHALLRGADLDAMSEEELRGRMSGLRVVSRVSPEGKMKIVKAFRSLGEIVAMNGDGINDAPALREADIGVAMGTGTDVAKDVSDLVLLDDNFETIVAAVHEGHRILENIRKAVVYLTSTVFNEIFLMGGALIMGVMMPLNALQILWVNFFTDSFPGISLAFEDKIDRLKDRQKRAHRTVFDQSMRLFLLINSVISSVLLLFTYVALLEHDFDPLIVRTFIFGAFGTYSLFLIFAVRSLRRSIFRYNPFSNPSLVLSVLIGFGLMMAAIYLPVLQRLFNTVSLPLPWFWAVIGFGIVNVFLIETIKLLFHNSEQ
ncbi:MAG: HAD-IC family P-type ATPase [bacterium]|nr:HAD-IC family P-type ATPase [bacterium]